MTHLQHTLELAGDIRDCANRTRDLGLAREAGDLEAIAKVLEWRARDGTAPGSLDANREARETATGRFRAARAILRGVLT